MTVHRALALLLAFALGSALPACLSAQAEPLTLRVSDAEGEPGGPVAVVLRTYASRPVSQGRLGVRATSGAPRIGGGLVPAGSGPLASFDGGTIFSAAGDVIGSFLFDPATQSLDAQFDSPTASINVFDGVLGVLFFTLDAGVAPGSTFDLLIDLGPTSFLTDAEGQPITWQPRAGKLDVRSAVTPRLLGVGAPKVHPGSGADVEIETAEPFALDSGVVEIHYPTDVLSGAPWVSADPRHGSVDFLVSEPQPGLVRIEFGSPGGDFNSVPGALFVLHLPTSPAVQIGVTRQISLEATTTELLAPGVPDPVAVDIRLNGDTLEFVSDPSVFYDNFEGGSLGGWSRRSP